MKTETYKTSIYLELAGHEWEIPVEAEFLYDPEDRAHDSRDSVEVCKISAVEPGLQAIIDGIPDGAVSNLTSEILEKIHNAKRHRVAYEDGYALGEQVLTDSTNFGDQS